MTVALYAVLFVMQWVTPEGVRLGWEAPALDPALLVAVALIFVELALLTAVALFFSTFSSSAISSTSLTLGVWIAGVFSPELRGFSDLMASRPAALVTTAVAAILPNFAAFDVKAMVVHGLHVPAGYVLLTATYGLLYAAATVGAAMAIFARREFK
jgi:ABC-type transport system involved in multi-copper enzyme maturation permease subunit